MFPGLQMCWIKNKISLRSVPKDPIDCKSALIQIPPHNEVIGGMLVSLCLSIRPASHVRSVVPTVLVGSIQYLYI